MMNFGKNSAKKFISLRWKADFPAPTETELLAPGAVFSALAVPGILPKNLPEIFLNKLKKRRQGFRKRTLPENISHIFKVTQTPMPRFPILNRFFSEAISHPDIVALSIGTRPDCLPDEVIELLAELNKIKPVWVELGLQTIHPKTAEYIRRGYELRVFDSAVERLKKAGIYVIVHMIIGLPGETPEMIFETAEYIGKSGADGIKLQLLHVLSGTDLAKDFEAGKFKTLELEEYIGILEECVRRLPPKVAIHRLTGDGNKKYLVAPLWSGDKKRVLNAINSAFEKDRLIQGERL